MANMSELAGLVVSVHTVNHADLHKGEQPVVQVELDGLVGDKHRGYRRGVFKGDVEPPGTVRRNERQWSAVSMEELAVIERRMDLREPLTTSMLRANLCLEGIPDLSQLPRGTRLHFPSGAVLRVEECNPPCLQMGEYIAAAYTTHSGDPIIASLFPKQALKLRGLVGVVDVAGPIRRGDRVVVRTSC